MSDNFQYPINNIIINQGGGGGPVTGSDAFFVNNNLDVHGKEINSSGDLILSSSTSNITISGNLNVLGTINAPVSGASTPVTGAGNFFVVNQLDLRGYLTNSLTNLVAISGNAVVQQNLTVNGTLIWTSSSIQPLLDTRYVLTSSYGPFTASQNSFSSSVNVFSASQLTLNSNLNLFSASINTLTQSLNSFSASINAFSASVNIFTASQNVFSASVNSFTASQLTLNSALNAFSASVNTLTASLTKSLTLAQNAAVVPAAGGAGVLYVSSATGDLWFSGATGNYQITPTASAGGGGGLAGGNVSTPYQYGILWSGSITFSASGQSVTVWTVPATINGYAVKGVFVSFVNQVFLSGTGNTPSSYGFTFGFNSTNNIFGAVRYLPTVVNGYTRTPLQYSNVDFPTGSAGLAYKAAVVNYAATSSAFWSLEGFFY